MSEVQLIKQWEKELMKLYNKYKSDRGRIGSVREGEDKELVEGFRDYNLNLLKKLSQSSLTKKKDKLSGNKVNYFFEIPEGKNNKYYLVEFKVSELKKGTRIDNVVIHFDLEGEARYQPGVVLDSHHIGFGNKDSFSIFPNSYSMKTHKYYKKLASKVK